MNESILHFSDELGFCTLIETTKSSLFSRGLSISSEPQDDDGFWFRASVPEANSSEFEQLRKIIGGNGSRLAPELVGATPILIEVARSEDILSWTPEKQARFASDLVNRFLRAYEHTFFDVSVPRHRLDGRPIVMITPNTQMQLEYKPVILELSDVVEPYLPAHMDVEQVHLEFLMGSPKAISPSWRILIDGARHFENGNLREAVLCACSAAEIVATPAVERWLDGNTLTPGGDGVRNAVREMGNPLRFELCISGACVKAFSDVDKEERAELLADLRGMNSLRNAVVHRGEEPQVTAAAAALRAAATFVCKIWLETLEFGGAET
jgi:hypothetical protein